MALSDEEKNRRWVETWKRAGPELERIKREELRNFRYEDHIETINALIGSALKVGTPRTTTGLVEQQRLFGKLRQ